MPTLRTNLLRVQLNTLAIQYQLDISSNIAIETDHLLQIEAYFYNIQPNVIFAHPFLYAKTLINQLLYQIYLSDGQCFTVKLQLVRKDIDSRTILDFIANKLIKISQLLFSPQLEYCINPYEQRKNDQVVMMPAYTIKPKEVQQQLCLYFVPMMISFDFTEEINQKSNILLDYSTGSFYSRHNIVRINKEKSQIHFRNNKIVEKGGLHPVTLKIINGFELGNELYHFYDRIRQTSKLFCELWQIKFDNYFLQNPYQYITPGSVTFRNNLQKSMSEIITPMNEYSWTQKLKSFYGNSCFDDILNGKIVFLYAVQMQTIIKQFTKHLEAINYRMNNNLAYSHLTFLDINILDQVNHQIIKHQLQNKGNLIYFIPYRPNLTKTQREALDRLIQILIDGKCIFHLAEIDKKDVDVQAELYRHLTVIYAKFMLNPWKIKSIPFTNKPMVVMTMDICLNRDNTFSISLVSTMNLYLSKFTSTHKRSSSQNLLQAIQLSIKECIQKFKQAHKIYPNRIFLIRNGITYDNILDEYNYIRSSIEAFNGGKVTYITLSTEHSLRSFSQYDNNYVSKDNVKKIQLLAYTKINGELYYQLQLQKPMHLVQVYELGEQDPNFTANILQLLAKIVFGSVGSSYGKGLGFIDFSKKLNEFREFNISSWSELLKEGYTTFI